MEREEETLEMLDEEEEERFQETCSAYVAAVASYVALDQFEDGPKGRKSGSKNVKRERVPVEWVCRGGLLQRIHNNQFKLEFDSIKIKKK